MGVDLGKGHGEGRGGSDDGRGHRHGAVSRSGEPAEEEDEGTQLEKYGIDERRLTPLGLHLPRVGFVPDVVFQAVRWVGLGAWIALYALQGQGGGGAFPWAGFLVMWLWIGGNAAYASATKELRRRRKRELRALRLEAQGGPPSGLPVREPRRAGRAAPARAVAPATDHDDVGRRDVDGRDGDRVEVPRISAAEKALVRTVRRVDTSERFERTDLVLVHEVSDLLGPLLARVAERGADAQVRHDLETLAAEHLPRTVDDYLALPPDYAREHRTPAGTTPAQELRNQLHLLLEGCERLRDAVHDADVDRQQQQSRFLEAKFRRSDLDL